MCRMVFIVSFFKYLAFCASLKKSCMRWPSIYIGVPFSVATTCLNKRAIYFIFRDLEIMFWLCPRDSICKYVCWFCFRYWIKYFVACSFCFTSGLEFTCFLCSILWDYNIRQLSKIKTFYGCSHGWNIFNITCTLEIDDDYDLSQSTGFN